MTKDEKLDRGGLPKPTQGLFRCSSDFQSIRGVLEKVEAFAAANQVGPNDWATLQIILAEALNNISEHAYREQNGPICTKVSFTDRGIEIELRDAGLPLPESILDRTPPKDSPSIPNALPEGGFGWILIMQLANSIHYGRVGNENRLTIKFRIAS